MAKGRLVNKTALAEILGVTHKTLTTYQHNGLPILHKADQKGKGNVYDTRQVLDWYVDYMIDRKFGHAEHATEALNKEYEQARLAKAQADGKNLENQIKRGELAPVELMTKVLAHVTAQITAVLDSIPQRIKRQVPKLTASEIELVKREIIKTQNAAAKIDLDLDQQVEDFIRHNKGSSTAGEADPADSQ